MGLSEQQHSPNLSAVACSDGARFGPGGPFLAVVSWGANVTVTLTYRIADYATSGAVVSGLAAACYRRQAVAIAIPV